MISRFSILMVLLLSMTAISVSAILPVVNYVPLNSSINNSDLFIPATYSFSIRNTGSLSDRYQLYTISAFWDINPTIVSVDTGAISTFTLEVTLTDKNVVGPQLVPVTIKSLNSGDTIVQNVYVYVVQSNQTPLTYVPNVATDIQMDSQIDPRQPVSIDVYMRNRNPLNISSLKIVVSSGLFSKEYTTDLGPLEEKTNQVLFSNLNPLQEPGMYTLTVSLMIDNNTVSTVQKEVEVTGYSDVNVDETKYQGLFAYTDNLAITNNGNENTTKVIDIEKNWFERIFTLSNLKYAAINKDGISYIEWSVPLKAQDNYDINVTTNYNPFVITIIVILAAIIIYYVFRSPLLLFKRAKISLSTDDGISEIRVKLHLKNRSGQLLKNVKVVDKYPKIVTLVEDNSIGTLKPTKMLSADKASSMLMWNIEQLEPYEERLLSYTIRSQLNIVGNMDLHPAKVRFVAKGAERSYTSNDVALQHRSENIIKYE